MEDIDKAIAEARRRPLTAENLNYIGDLYRRKGDRTTAISCYYDAAEKLHFAQKEKKIAIFKKVISLSPSEERAYEQLIFLFAKLGLAADEKNYLLQLVKLYEGKGEYNKINSLFRRILEIDPRDEMALSFFSKGKIEGEGEDAVVAPEPQRTDRAILPAVDQRRHGAAEVQSAAPEPHAAPLPTQASHPFPGLPPDPRKRNLLVGALVVLLLAAAVILVVLSSRQGRERQQTAEGRRLGPVVMNGYAVAVEFLGAGDAARAGADSGLQSALRVEIRGGEQCIPVLFVSEPVRMVSLSDSGGKSIAFMPAKSGDRVRVVNKMNVCGQESAPVFVSLILLYDNKAVPAELLIQGLAETRPLKIPLSGGSSR